MAIANTQAGWVNSDGLRVKFAGDEKVLAKGGTFSAGIGHEHITEFDIDYATVALGTSATNVYILDYDVYLPDGAVIDKVEFQVGTAWDSTSSDVTLNFGLVKRSDFTTIISATGLVAALPKAQIDTFGAVVPIYQEGAATYIGASVGAALAFDSVVSCHWTNHAPTQGTGKLRIFWRG